MHSTDSLSAELTNSFGLRTVSQPDMQMQPSFKWKQVKDLWQSLTEHSLSTPRLK